MYYWICLRADRSAGLFQVNTDKPEVPYGDFEYIKSECGMKYAETVSFEYDGVPYMMLVDEEGKLNGKTYNQLASGLYFYDSLVGDVAILAHPSKEEMMYLPKADADALWKLVSDVRYATIEWPE